MKKQIFFIILILIFMANISALKITEFESNPSGADTGNEWIELYSKDEINLQNYKLINNDGDEIELNKTFEGYYVFIFEKQWLDNSDEKLMLYKGGELIYETEIFKDDKNNGQTWQLCDNWEFKEGTKGKENNCETEEEIKDLEEEENSEDYEEEFAEKEKINSQNTGKIEFKEIKLSSNPKDIKTGDDKKGLTKKDYATYGFVLFCVLLGILFIRKKKLEKNEFR